MATFFYGVTQNLKLKGDFYLMVLDLTKEDLVLKDFYVSNVSKFNSRQGKELISVQLVGSKKYTALPGLLYFGTQTVEDLSAYVGKKINVLLGASQQGFNIQSIQTA
ncbi:hypothetical protein [Heyndrickxia oleronia]|uniref:hypothetical protein n=1 Tax=Heyndrickxia oleronia TaxID=38875 RepID=UPI003750F1AE